MTTPRLYDDLAHLWPRLSPPAHYVPEAEHLRRLLRERRPPAGDRRPAVLELGAGGGHTLHHLRDEFDCVAVDLSEPMLANCRALNPDVPTHVGDMRTVRLGRTFDAVLIHDAIDYMLTEDDLLATLHTAGAHLDRGGLALIAPTYTADTFVDNDVADDGTTTDDADLTYFTYVHDPDPADTTFEMILLYLIRDARTRRVEVVEDRHTCGLFPAARWLALMERAGFAAELDPPSNEDEAAWTLFVGTKR